MGRFIFHIMSALAEMERELIVERTRAGLAAAREKGRIGGRRPKLTQEQWDQAGRPIENALDRKLIAKMDTLSERGFLGEKLGANLGAKISLGAYLGALNRPLLSDNVPSFIS